MENEHNENTIDVKIKERKIFNYHQAKDFYKRNLMVHVSVNRAGIFSFYNGFITRPPTEEYIFINDREDGVTKVLFSELNKKLVEFAPE